MLIKLWSLRTLAAFVWALACTLLTGSLLLFPTSNTTNAAPIKVNSINTVNIGVNGATELVVNSATNRIYALTGDKVSRIDGNTNTLVGSVPAISTIAPFLGVNSANNRVYFVSADSVSPNYIVAVMDGDTLSIVKTISLDGLPFGMAVHTATNRIYLAVAYQPDSVGKFTATKIVVLDGATNNIITNIPLTFPITRYLAIDPAVNQLYIQENLGSGSIQRIQIIDTTTNTISSNITISPIPGASSGILAFNPVSKRFYISSGSNISVVDIATKSIIKNIEFPNVIYDIDVDAVNNRVYVANYNEGKIGLTIIDSTSNNVLATISGDVFPNTINIVVNPTTKRVYAIGNGQLKIFTPDDLGVPAKLVATYGITQTAQISTTFALPLQVKLTDAQAVPVYSNTITFSSPVTADFGTFNGSNTTVTDAQGNASVYFSAGNLTGTFTITANTNPPLATPAIFTLTNVTEPLGTFRLLPATVRVATTLDKTGSTLTSSGLIPKNYPNSSSTIIKAGGVGGIPANATGIAGILTNIDCFAGGNFRFWTGKVVPANATNLNVPSANPKLNLSASFVTPLDAKGEVNLGLGSGAANNCGWAVDVVGYFTSATTSGNNFALLSSTTRLATTLDNSRPKLVATGLNPKNPPDTSSVAIQAGGVGDIPADAIGIFGTLTNVDCSGGGNFRFWAGSTVPTDANNLNVPGANPNLNLSASFITPLDAQGKVNLGLGNTTNSSCGYAVDVTGFIRPAGTGSNSGLSPVTTRVATTLNNGNPLLTATGLVPSNPPDKSAVSINLKGNSAIPAGAKGIMGVLTNVSCNGGGNFRFWTGSTVPNLANNLNVPGANSALNLSASFIVPIDNQGKVNLGLGSGASVSCGYAVDIAGFIN